MSDEMDARVTRSLALRSLGVLLLCLGMLPGAMAAGLACDPAAPQARLQVRVAGVAKAKGNMTITVYPDDAQRFLAKGGKLQRQRLPATVPVTTACFALPAAGSYAVVVYHDANNDHDFNRTFVGMPAEGYGFSRNPKSLLGLPSLAEVRFAAHLGDNPVEISLSY